MATITRDQLYKTNWDLNSGDTDFIGFSFNGVTSKSLGIIRVSDGSRYTEQMLPNFQDKTAQMPGSDYTLYWESFYNTKTWTISIAFDNMTENQMKLFRQTFNTKNMGELKFDENKISQYPKDVYWLAKIQSPPQLKYIAFEEEGYRLWNEKFLVPGGLYYTINSSNQYVPVQDLVWHSGTKYYESLSRIYKGEGIINFISYYPFGMSEYKIVPAQGTGAHTYITSTANNTYDNYGDISMDWVAFFEKTEASKLTSIECRDLNDNQVGLIQFKNGIVSNDVYIAINSKTNLIEGCDSINLANNTYHRTDNIYNGFITGGDFFQIPIGRFKFLPQGTNNVPKCYELGYKYLYL